MNLARSTFYYRRQALPAKDAALVKRIEQICLDFPGYGYRRVTEQLKQDQKFVNHKKVLRLMREHGLLCRVQRRKTRTTNSRHHFPRYPNIIKGMVVTEINRLWLADITYIRIRRGFVYLAAILDAYSRRAIGYAISTTLETSLATNALRMAIATRHPTPGIVHHSDQGVQYASEEYNKELRKCGFVISMSRSGNPYDNATMEASLRP